MKKTVVMFFIAVFILGGVGRVSAQGIGTVFTYQGKLNDGGSPANGPYDFEFKLFDAENGGGQVGDTIIKDDIAVFDGHFTVELDFGVVFTGDNRWLQIGVRPGGYVGIGTVYPDQLLHVNGLSNPRMLVEAPASATPELNLKRGANTYSLFMGSDNSLNFFNAGIKATLTGGGNLGIGTTGPTQKLDVDYGNILVQGTGSFDFSGEEAVVYLGDGWQEIINQLQQQRPLRPLRLQLPGRLLAPTLPRHLALVVN